MTDLDIDKSAPDTATEWYRSPLALIAGFILFLGVLAIVVLAATGGDDDTGETVAASESTAPTAGAEAATSAPIAFGGAEVAEVNDVTVVGDALDPLVAGEDTAIGTQAPTVTASSLANGNPITLEPGKARVIGFFAHWCPHCQDELPEVTEWLNDNQLPPNTEFIAVSTAVDEGRGNYPPSAWFNDVGFNAPVLVDDANGTLITSMGFGGFPAFIAVDASGVVVDRAGGNIGIDGLESMFAKFAS